MEEHSAVDHANRLAKANMMLGILLAAATIVVPSWVYSTELYVYFRFLITDFFDTAFRFWYYSMYLDIVDLAFTTKWLLRSIALATCAGLALATVFVALSGKAMQGSPMKSRELLPWVVSIYTIIASTGVTILDYISLVVETGGVYPPGAFGWPPYAFALLGISITMLIINWTWRRARN